MHLSKNSETLYANEMTINRLINRDILADINYCTYSMYIIQRLLLFAVIGKVKNIKKFQKKISRKQIINS